jgi:glycosyltransferase involved in cell wall biosynthesis
MSTGTLRIALVSREYPPAVRSGGIGTYTEKTARALAALGHEVHVFTEGTSHVPSSEDSLVHLHRLPEVGGRPDEQRVIRRAWAVAGALWRIGPCDVVQACEWDAEAVIYSLRRRSILVTRLATPAYVVNRLNGSPARAKVRAAAVGRLERFQTRRSDHVISPSLALANLVTTDWKLDPRRVSVVPTGIEMPSAAVAAPPRGFAGRKYVLYFGRLETRKGVKTWIDALARVLAEDAQLWAVFAGQDLGMLGTPFTEYARLRLGPLMERVAFFPRLPHAELFPLVAGAALVVMPSIWESLANACLEAMALGRPVVATTGSGFSEVIRDGVDGFLVAPQDHDRLATAVIGALANRARLEEVGHAARLRARDFGLDKMAFRLLDVYRDLVHETRGWPAVDTAV